MIRIAIAFGLLLGLLSPLRSLAQDDCHGCKELRVLERKIKDLPLEDDHSRKALLQKAATAIESIGRKGSGRLTTLQAKEIIELLRITRRFDPLREVIDVNAELFKKSLTLFKERLKSLPPSEEKALLDEIRMVIDENESGNDPALTPLRKDSGAEPAKPRVRKPSSLRIN